MRVVVRVYALLLRLYPPRFRAEFAEEMQGVFEDALTDSVRHGQRYAALWCAHELSTLPAEVARAHWHTRRGQTMNSHSSRTETLLALSPLFIGIASLLVRPFATGMPAWVSVMMAVAFTGTIAGLFIAGLLKGLPRWVLPYTGFALIVLVLYVHGWAGNWFAGAIKPLYGTPYMGIAQWLYPAMLWLSLPIAAVLGALIVAVTPPFRALWNRLRRDWTLLSFALYGAGVFALLLAFEEYRGQEPYLVIGLLCLAAGVWAYLNSKNTPQRILALFAGITLALAVAAVGKWFIRPHQTHWPSDILTDANRLNEVGSTIALWAWVVFAVLAPSLLELLPRRQTLSPNGQG